MKKKSPEDKLRETIEIVRSIDTPLDEILIQAKNPSSNEQSTIQEVSNEDKLREIMELAARITERPSDFLNNLTQNSTEIKVREDPNIPEISSENQFKNYLSKCTDDFLSSALDVVSKIPFKLPQCTLYLLVAYSAHQSSRDGKARDTLKITQDIVDKLRNTPGGEGYFSPYSSDLIKIHLEIGDIYHMLKEDKLALESILTAEKIGQHSKYVPNHLKLSSLAYFELKSGMIDKSISSFKQAFEDRGEYEDPDHDKFMGVNRAVASAFGLLVHRGQIPDAKSFLESLEGIMVNYFKAGDSCRETLKDMYLFMIHHQIKSGHAKETKALRARAEELVDQSPGNFQRELGYADIVRIHLYANDIASAKTTFKKMPDGHSRKRIENEMGGYSRAWMGREPYLDFSKFESSDLDSMRSIESNLNAYFPKDHLKTEDGGISTAPTSVFASETESIKDSDKFRLLAKSFIKMGKPELAKKVANGIMLGYGRSETYMMIAGMQLKHKDYIGANQTIQLVLSEEKGFLESSFLDTQVASYSRLALIFHRLNETIS